MKTKVTKKVKQELKQLLNNYGYWSNKVREYIEQFDYTARRKLHNIAIAYEKYREDF